MINAAPVESLHMLTHFQERILVLLLHDNKSYYNLSNRLRENLFFDEDLLRIFRAFKELLEKSIKPSAGSIQKHTGNKEDYARILRINLYTQDTDMETCLQGLEDEQRKAKTIKFLDTLSWNLTSLNYDKILPDTRQFVDEYANVAEKSIKDIKQRVKDFISHTEEITAGVSGIATGFKVFDKFSGGLQPGSLTVMAGGTSQGKTTAAMSTVYNVSLVNKTPTALFSLEMSEMESMARLLAIDTGLASKDMLRGRVDFTEFNKQLNLHNSALIIDDCYSINLDYLLNQMRYYTARFGIKFFVIDYLQMIVGNNRMNREQETGHICRALKNFARETGSAVLLLSQLSRAKDKRKSPEPILSDLRDSGQIEEAADNVMLIYRPEYYGIHSFEDGGESTAGKGEIILAKGRNIGTMRFRVDFIKQIPVFVSENEMPDKYKKHIDVSSGGEGAPF